MDPDYSKFGFEEPVPSESSSVFSDEISDHDGHFSYSECSPKYDDDSFDLDSGFKKLRIKDDKDGLPVQYNESGPIHPIFPFYAFSNLKKGDPEYFGNLQLVPHNNTLHIAYRASIGAATFAGVLQYLNSKTSVPHQKYIQHLAVDFQCYDLSRKEFRKMIEFLAKSFPSTRYLYLNFRDSITKNRTDQDLIWLSLHITKYMPNLKHFTLQFNGNALITSQGFKIFCRQIAKRSKRLEYLSLDFGKCQNISWTCLKSLTKYMSTCLRNLKGLRLNILLFAETNQKLLSFNKTRFLKQVESFELSIDQPFPNMAGKLQKDLRQLTLFLKTGFSVHITSDQISSYLHPLQNLKFLTLHLPMLSVMRSPNVPDISQEGPRKLVETLNTKIKTLNSLKINFVSCKQVQSFLKLLKCPEENQLTKLEIGFDSFNEASAKRSLPMEFFPDFVSNFLQHLKNLTYLDLKLQTVLIQDIHVKNMTACIAKNLHQLEFLNIYFFLCPEITDESVRSFQEDFSAENALLNLKTLILSFSNCHQITKKPIKSLRSSLRKRKPTIESAVVNFLDYQDDSNYDSSDDEDHDIARQMAANWGPQWKAIKTHPDADPNVDSNWRVFARKELEARESSYYESDGENLEGEISEAEKDKGNE